MPGAHTVKLHTRLDDGDVGLADTQSWIVGQRIASGAVRAGGQDTGSPASIAGHCYGDGVILKEGALRGTVRVRVHTCVCVCVRVCSCVFLLSTEYSRRAKSSDRVPRVVLHYL